MRSLIVKLFALDYIVKMGDKNINFVRASTILLPLFCLNGILAVKNGVLFDNFSFFGTISFVVLLLAIYFGFFYFRKHSIEWHELDKSQKWQFGKHSTLDGFKYALWSEIDSQKQMYSPLWVLLINPIVSLITVIILIL